MGGVVRESFKFHGRPQSLNQSPAHQPGWRAANSIFAARRFGLAHRRRGAAGPHYAPYQASCDWILSRSFVHNCAY
jgi:hypothetical protein